MEALKNIASITTMVYFFMLRKYTEFSKLREEIPRCINRKKFYLALLMMHVFSITSAVSNFFDVMDCSAPGYSVYGILQARILEWVDMSSSRESSKLRDPICVS